MKSLSKKLLIFVLVMGVVAASGWFGRKAYKRAAERRSIAEAKNHLAKSDLRSAVLCLQRAMQINPLSLEPCQIMANISEAAGAPAAISWRIRVSQLQPNNMTNRLEWAETALKLRDLKSAAEALDGLDETAKRTARYHKLAGAMSWSLGKPEQAEAHYREALRMEPTNPTIVLNLDTIGLASTNLESVSAARQSLRQVATNNELRVTALRYLSAEAGARKSYQEAINYSQQIVDEPKASLGDKIDYLQLLHLANAANFETWLAKLKQESTQSPAEAFALGRWMAASDNPTNALSWLQSLPASIQTNQPVPLIVADCRLALKDWNGLLTLTEKQEWGEADYFRLAVQARAQRSLGQDLAFQTFWRKALRLANQRIDRLGRLAEATAAWAWDTENTEVLKEIVASFPKERWASDQLVTKIYATGDTRALADLLAKLYAADPSDARSKNNLANISLLRKADLERAYKLAREAYDSAPENPFFISTYAYSLLLQNKQEMAHKIVSNLKPQYLQIPSVAAYCGVVEAQSGNKELAKAHLEKAAAGKLLPEEKEIVRLAKASL